MESGYCRLSAPLIQNGTGHFRNSAGPLCREKITSLVVDLSGVPIVDTMVAQQLYNLSKTLFLLGVKAVFSGIRPDVAQTSIQLGLDFSEYETYGTLKQALENMGVRCIVEELEENK